MVILYWFIGLPHRILPLHYPLVHLLDYKFVILLGHIPSEGLLSSLPNLPFQLLSWHSTSLKLQSEPLVWFLCQYPRLFLLVFVCPR